MKIWRSILCVVSIGLLLSSGFASSADNPMRSALGEIKENQLRAHIQFLADDLLEGRGVGSRGEQLAVRYIAAQFEAMGLLPGAADGSYFQKVPMLGITPDPALALHFRCGDETITAKYQDDFVAVTATQTSNVDLQNKELVFVGYGIQAPEFEWDDFKRADLKGKILLVLNNDPDTGDPNFFGGKTRLFYGRWDYKYKMANKIGADGAIVIHTTPSAGYPWQVVRSSWTGEQYELPLSEPAIPMQAWITEEKIKEILKTKNIDLQSLCDAAQKRDFIPVPLGIQISIRIQSAIRSIEGVNVLGLLPGSDPQHKDEAVIFTAHHDHLGIGEAVDGDAIYNGALDNASGVGSLLTIAEACSRLPERPKRSLLFLADTAEESGLLGSSYFAKHPTFPPEKIAADLNMDGAGIFGRTRDLIVLGLGKTTMDSTIRKMAESQGRIVLPDQMPEKGMFYRCDHFSFAQTGVPSLSFDNGLEVIGKPEGWGKQKTDEFIEKHYHQPSDEYDPSWNLEGMVEDAQLVFQVGVDIANQDELPQWTPGDEFEKLRKK